MPLYHQPCPSNGSFFALLYRFYFFDWLFADLTRVTGLLERHAAWKHNREMRKYLPIYLRRWAVLAVVAFLAGCICENVFAAQWAASWCFTGFSATMVVMVIIVVAWLFMAQPTPR